jgi:hypothetical protein
LSLVHQKYIKIANHIKEGWRSSLFKSRIVKTTIAFVSYTAAIITAPQQVLAQLNIGRYGIQPGLEPNYLRYQLSGRDLTQLRGIPVCNDGFGAGCDKSATVLQQIIESNNGPTYQELLIRAAGGQANYQNFAAFYGNDPNLSSVPLSSFWANDDPRILDGYRYTIDQPVSRTPVQGLGQVTQNFYWSPERTGNSESLRDGLLNWKYSYGRLLLEEAAKIPNVQEQIQALNLPPDVKQFYSSQISQGVRSLRSGNPAKLQSSILEVLSRPFNNSNAEYNRPPLGIPEEYAALTGIDLQPDSFLAAVPAELPVGESASLVPPFLLEDSVVTQAVPGVASRGAGFPWWVLGAIPLAVLPFAFGGGGDDDDSSRAQNVPPVTPPVTPPGEQPPVTPPGEQPPVTPPGEQPPVTPPGEQPPVTPPGEQPPVTPPGEQPPVTPPGEQPPITPPGEQPPITPPGEQPPITPPGEQPPITPPGEQPPITPPGEQPPITPPGEQPPVTPPGEQPPVTPPVTPPGEQPPVTPPVTPPGEQPPVTPPVTPPGEQPPVKIPESSTLTPLLVLTFVMSLFGYKKWLVRKS